MKEHSKSIEAKKKDENHTAHQNGRPTKTEQLQMQKSIRKFFELGISATVTASKTGINIKTVCKYFDVWSEQIRDSESKDFLERQKNVRSQIIVTLDTQILSIHEELDDVETQIKKFKQEHKIIPNQLFSLRLEISKFLSNLTEKKGIFMMQPIMDEGLMHQIKEMVKEYAKA